MLSLVSLAKDRDGHPKGFAFVTFENEQGAEEAVNGASGQVNFHFTYINRHIGFLSNEYKEVLLKHKHNICF